MPKKLWVCTWQMFRMQHYALLFCSSNNMNDFSMAKVQDFFATTLITWYEHHQRDLPWRKTRDPYLIWLSEIILQQTRVKQGLPYFMKFVEAYPNVDALAQAPEDEVLRLWQGLGYYSRARNLHSTARYISQELQGQFPQTYDALLKLKGVGKYTAAAIASFAFLEKVPVLDGNVYRVLSRYFGLDIPIDQSRSFQEYFNLAQRLIPEQSPDQFNQAIMEFGAMHCSPAKPNCMLCPFVDTCQAYAQNLTQSLPVKLGKTKTRPRYFNYLLICGEERLLLKKREGKDVWQGLYEFILVEDSSLWDDEKLPHKMEADYPGLMQFYQKSHGPYKHILSHQKIHANFHQFVLPEKQFADFEIQTNSQGYTAKQIEELPKPILLDKFWKAEIFH